MHQNRELDIARFIVEKTSHNLFLTGKAGTGKTTFLRDVNRHTRKRHIVLAPTGVAAVNAGAMTIHSFFQFGFGPYVKGISVPEPSFNMRREKLELIRSLELIIIDEVSMVRADVLDHINDELQRIRHSTEPFGGVQLLMIGDLHQLPPVATENELALLNAHYNSMYFFDCKSLRNSDYYCIGLKSVYRQTDQHFIDILNRVRRGNVTRDDLNELNSHYVADFTPAVGDHYIQLVTHNHMANKINKKKMDELSNSAFRFEGSVKGTFPEDSCPTNITLELKEGAQVMFVKNDPDRKYVNGTLGVVDTVSDNEIKVKIFGKDTIVQLEPAVWENVRYHMNEETHLIESTKIGSFTQYPIKPAWAITIHKSQGLTFDKAVIDARSAFSPGQAYVALSRCRSLDGMVLSKRITKRAIMSDSIVDEYMNGALQDINILANNIDYEPFDYDRSAEASSANTSGSNEELAISNTDVYEALKSWRRSVANEDGIPAYTVMHNRTLAELSNVLPESLSELESIRGLGARKIERYGQMVLDTIRRAIDAPNAHSDTNNNGIEANAQESRPMRLRSRDITYRMFLDGKTIEQIAQERSLTQATVVGHLVHYVETGDIDLHSVVSNSTIVQVSDYLRGRSQGDISMRDIYEHVNHSISYSQIRLILSYLNRDN